MFDEKSVILAQSAWRAKIARGKLKKNQENHILCEDLYRKGVDLVKNEEQLRNTPISPYGQSTVYLPPDYPIVIKTIPSLYNSRVKEYERRFKGMLLARNVCDREGFKHLTVPKVKIYKTRLIESKIEFSIKDQAKLYMKNRDLFTEAAKEFARFICMSHVSDIRAYFPSASAAASSRSVYMGRYDNFPLYIEDGKGKVGLIDLGNYHPKKELDREKLDTYLHVTVQCEAAISMFPLHYEEIIKVCQEYAPDLGKRDNFANLKNTRDEALARLNFLASGRTPG